MVKGFEPGYHRAIVKGAGGAFYKKRAPSERSERRGRGLRSNTPNPVTRSITFHDPGCGLDFSYPEDI